MIALHRLETTIHYAHCDRPVFDGTTLFPMRVVHAHPAEWTVYLNLPSGRKVPHETHYRLDRCERVVHNLHEDCRRNGVALTIERTR